MNARRFNIGTHQVSAAPITELNTLLASESFLNDLSYITGIPRLIPDEQLVGGGLHVTGPGGRLDVHVDFNYSGPKVAPPPESAP